MNKYSGYVDPSLYAVIINAKECGWVPRPPSIPITSSQEVISKLKKTSSRISNTGKLDLRFATSLHERKHFLDLHLSSLLWQSFLSWFHCSTQIFTIVSLLKGKKISFPLYSPLGTLRYDNPFTQQERVIIHDICKTIFSAKIHQRLKYSLEISASLLQYSFLHESYELNDNDGSAPLQYYQSFFDKPLQAFSGDITKAFSCYSFLSWFCIGYSEFEIIEQRFQIEQDFKKTVYALMKEKYYTLKIGEIDRDIAYLGSFSKSFVNPDTKYFPDVKNFLSELINFRKDTFSSIDHVMELLTNMDYFYNWISKNALKTNYLVDFGEELSLHTEITENYYASKWIVKKQQFLYYDDQLGKQILNMNQLDDLINIQLLSALLISPVKLFHFNTKTFNSDFLECEICT